MSVKVPPRSIEKVQPSALMASALKHDQGRLDQPAMLGQRWTEHAGSPTMAETEEPADPPEPVDKEAVDPGEEAFDPSEMTAYSSADFHNVVQKHVLNVLYETMIETKL